MSEMNPGFCGTGNVYDPTLPSNSGQAVPLNTGPSVSDVITQLAGYIEFTHLAQSLRDRIDIITSLEDGFNNLNTLVVTDNSVMSQQLMGLRDDLTGALAYINTQVNVEISERQALVTSVNQLVAALEGGLTAALQDESTVRAEQTGALFAERTIKADLAGNVTGFGLSAYVDPEGNFTSDFRVAADTFSIAPPAYSSPTPPPANQLFEGKVWVDTSGGGSVTKWYTGSGWSLTPVEAAQPFVYLSTPLTLPDGTVIGPGLYVNSATIGKISANQIDTRGLTIKDEAGNVIFGSGTGLTVDQIFGLGSLATADSVAYSSITGTKPPTDADRTATNIAAGISGQGALATANDVRVGSTVKFADGTVMNTTDFVNKLSKINSTNIGTFMSSAAIGSAYIGNAAIGSAHIVNLSVDSLKIKDGAVTTQKGASGTGSCSTSVTIPSGATKGAIIAIASKNKGGSSISGNITDGTLTISGNGVSTSISVPREVDMGKTTTTYYYGPAMHMGILENLSPGSYTISASFSSLYAISEPMKLAVFSSWK